MQCEKSLNCIQIRAIELLGFEPGALSTFNLTESNIIHFQIWQFFDFYF